MALENVNNYLSATHTHLGIEIERYGGSYRAIVAHRTSVDFLFDQLGGDDNDGTQAQYFFADNPLFPSARGSTASEALENLNTKLGILYRFESLKFNRIEAIPNFRLIAEDDCDSNDEQTFHNVNWDDIVFDLRSSATYFYEHAKEDASTRKRRSLFALINFQYKDEFKHLNQFWGFGQY